MQNTPPLSNRFINVAQGKTLDRFSVYELHDAAREGDKYTLLHLLAMGMSVEQPTRWGQTPLVTAVEAGQTEIVRLLIGKGANVNATNKSTQTVLMLAVRDGHTEIEGLLRVAGALTETKTWYGYKAADYRPK